MKQLDVYTENFIGRGERRQKGKGSEIHLYAHSEHPVKCIIKMYVNGNGNISRMSLSLFTYDKNERRLYMRNLRNMAMFKLGDKCSRCGIRDKRVLQFNHINGGGNKEHQAGGIIRERRNRFYQDIIEGKRTDINLLCANCNQIYEYEQKRRWE